MNRYLNAHVNREEQRDKDLTCFFIYKINIFQWDTKGPDCSNQDSSIEIRILELEIMILLLKSGTHS